MILTNKTINIWKLLWE